MVTTSKAQGHSRRFRPPAACAPSTGLTPASLLTQKYHPTFIPRLTYTLPFSFSCSVLSSLDISAALAMYDLSARSDLLMPYVSPSLGSIPLLRILATPPALIFLIESRLDAESSGSEWSGSDPPPYGLNCNRNRIVCQPALRSRQPELQ